jgi:imidazolonepropionase-like amidohydrolase
MRRLCVGQIRTRSRGVVKVVALLLVFAGPVHAATRSDHVLVKDIVAGAQTVRSDGRDTVVDYSYVDRRPRDEIHARWRLDASGVLHEYSAHGRDDSGAPIEERFAIQDGRASWNNRFGRFTTNLRGPVFFLPANPPPEIINVLARALLKAPEHRLQLLPAGEASIEPAAAADLELEHGKRKHLLQYRISGLEFTPISVWLDPDGESAARATDWLSVLPSEWGTSVAPLLAAADASDAAWSAEIASRLTHTPRGPLVIRHARLFDPRDLSVTPSMSVEVRGDWIVRVGSDDAVEPPPGAEVIDAQGSFLMPGLWDNHQHFEGVHGALDLACGVTSARDMANDTDVFIGRVARFDAGTELGPRVFKAGVIDGNGPGAAPTKMRPDTAEEAIADVDWYVAHGYGQIKIYSSVKPAVVGVIADEGHAHGLRVSGHVPTGMTARQFVAAGADEIQHLHYVATDILRILGRDPGSGFIADFGERAAGIDLSDARAKDFIEMLAQRHIVLDPTVALYEGLYGGQPAAPLPGLETIVARFPVSVRTHFLSGAFSIPKGQEDAYHNAFPTLLKLLAALHTAGITIIPGTDSLPGYGLQRELEVYVQAGIRPAEVLRMATLTSAQVSGASHERGVVAPGKRADFILIDGDPTIRIGDITYVRTTFKGGKRFEAAEVERALGISPRTESSSSAK